MRRRTSSRGVPTRWRRFAGGSAARLAKRLAAAARSINPSPSALKRFVADQFASRARDPQSFAQGECDGLEEMATLARFLAAREYRKPEGMRVAIIGSGPAGLAAGAQSGTHGHGADNFRSRAAARRDALYGLHFPFKMRLIMLHCLHGKTTKN
jgi:hypothetical protein